MTKTEKDIKLLGQCIEHWGTDIRDGEKPGSDACALCEEYSNYALYDICKGCPIREHTGRHGCRGTPFDQITALEYFDDSLWEPTVDAMIKFMENLKSNLEKKL